MSDNSIHTPHDRFFKRIFLEPSLAQNFLEVTLESDLNQKIDFTSLRIDNTTYIDKKLKAYYSDVVYDCRLKENAALKVVFLLEHKSAPSDYPHLQILRYMLSIWENNIKKKEALSPVIPIIIYHGKRVWESKTFEQYFKSGKIDPSLEKYIPQFDYWLSDLRQVGLEDIKQTYSQNALQIAFALMKHIFDPDIASKLIQIFETLPQLIESESGKELFDPILLYLYNSTETKIEEIQNIMNELGIQNVSLPGSTAWKLKKEGREEGIKEGREEGIKEGREEGIKEGREEGIKEGREEGIKEGIEEAKLTIAKNLLLEGSAIEFIVEVTGIPTARIKELQKEL